MVTTTLTPPVTDPTPTADAGPRPVPELAPAVLPSTGRMSQPTGTDGRQPPVRLSGPPAPSPVVVTLAVIMTASVIAAFFGVFAFGLSGLQQERSQRQLYAEFRGLLDPSSPTAPSIGGTIAPGTPVALVDAPQAGLHNEVVVEGTSSGTLLNGPGHLSDTPLPGQAGNAVLLGKSATAGAPFARITQLRRGDIISVRTGQGNFQYSVLGQVAAGARLPTIARDSGLLTLVTTGGSGRLGRLASDRLIYVDAKLQSTPVGAPSGRTSTVTPQNLPGHNDPGAWPWVGLWLLVLLAGSVGIWWLWSRWGLLQTWLVGAPVLFAVLWGLSDEAMRLLPNVY